jgi:hypothetical protein
MDVVLLLHEDKGRQWVAGGYGIFEIRNSKVVPLATGFGEHQRFAGMTADAFLADVLARRQQVR